MKKVLLFLLVTLTAGVFAQSSIKEDLEIIQGVYGKSKKELASSFMAIPEVQNALFWKIYDEFEVERKTLGAAKVAIINEYAANYASLTDASADKVAKEGLKNNLDYQKLLRKYYGKYKKAVGGLTAAKIIQFENYMQVSVQSELQEAIPLIGEMEASKK